MTPPTARTLDVVNPCSVCLCATVVYVSVVVRVHEPKTAQAVRVCLCSGCVAE